jgi:hypothetical protein
VAQENRQPKDSMKPLLSSSFGVLRTAIQFRQRVDMSVPPAFDFHVPRHIFLQPKSYKVSSKRTSMIE